MSTFITRMLENEERSRTILAAIAAASALIAVGVGVLANFLYR